MKKQILMVLAVMLLFVELIFATVKEVYPGNLYTQLNSIIGNADVLHVKFKEPGDYIFNTPIKFENNSKIILDGQKGVRVIVLQLPQDMDDYFICFERVDSVGKVYSQEVEIRDIEFCMRMEDLPIKQAHYLKMFGVQSALIENVKMTVQDERVNCIDIRGGKNITIRDSEFYSYTQNADDAFGGVLWFRGDMENVRILNNLVLKNGNDDAIAFWDMINDNDSVENVVRKDISISGNTFIYNPIDDNSVGVKNDALIKLFCFSQESEYSKPCHFEDISIDSNTILSRGHTQRLIGFSFNGQSTGKGLSITNNHIKCTDYEVVGDNTVFHRTFSVESIDENDVEVSIEDNVVEYDCKYIGGGYSTLGCLELKGGLVKFNRNKVISRNLDNECTLIGCDFGRNYIYMNDNQIENIKYLAQASSSDTTNLKSFNIYAKCNKFSGSNWIYCRNLQNMNGYFVDNQFDSNSNSLLFVGMARNANFTFIGNTFTRPTFSNLATLYAESSTTNFNAQEPKVWTFYAIDNNFMNCNPTVLNSISQISDLYKVEGNTFLNPPKSE